MSTLLIINSSPRSQSGSHRLAQHFVDEWKRRDPAAHIVERDSPAHLLPLVSEPWIQAAHLPEEWRTPEQEKILSFSNTLIDEVMSADVIVLGVPMHSFSVPASLKVWIGHVVRAEKPSATASRARRDWCRLVRRSLPSRPGEVRPLRIRRSAQWTSRYPTGRRFLGSLA